MAGNSTMPLTYGVGGPVIGTASIDENGIIMAEIEDETIQRKFFVNSDSLSISVYNKEN
jgi:hypothetical protein